MSMRTLLYENLLPTLGVRVLPRALEGEKLVLRARREATLLVHRRLEPRPDDSAAEGQRVVIFLDEAGGVDRLAEQDMNGQVGGRRIVTENRESRAAPALEIQRYFRHDVPPLWG